MGKSFYFVFLREREGEAGQTGLELANLNNLSRLWGIEAIPGCLVPGQMGTRAGV